MKKSKLVQIHIPVPKKVSLLGEEWKIKVDKELCEKKKVKGCVIFGGQTIFLNDNNKHADRTVLHELCHIRDYLLGGKHTEQEIKLESMFWRDVMKELYPIVRRQVKNTKQKGGKNGN